MRQAHRRYNPRQGSGSGSGRPRQGGNQQPKRVQDPHMQPEQNQQHITPQQRRHASNQQNKFFDLAKNAQQAGERVESEYYMQHVEHYTRVLNEADAQQREREESRRRGSARSATDTRASGRKEDGSGRHPKAETQENNESGEAPKTSEDEPAGGSRRSRPAYRSQVGAGAQENQESAAGAPETSKAGSSASDEASGAAANGSGTRRRSRGNRKNSERDAGAAPGKDAQASPDTPTSQGSQSPRDSGASLAHVLPPGPPIE